MKSRALWNVVENIRIQFKKLDTFIGKAINRFPSVRPAVSAIALRDGRNGSLNEVIQISPSVRPEGSLNEEKTNLKGALKKYISLFDVSHYLPFVVSSSNHI